MSEPTYQSRHDQRDQLVSNRKGLAFTFDSDATSDLPDRLARCGLDLQGHLTKRFPGDTNRARQDHRTHSGTDIHFSLAFFLRLSAP
jgi:hypothetical protein